MDNLIYHKFTNGSLLLDILNLKQIKIYFIKVGDNNQTKTSIKEIK